MTTRPAIQSARKLVLKLGTAVITSEDGHPDTTLMASIAKRLAAWRTGGRSITIVSSGAVGAGMGLISARGDAPTDVAELQAAAAAGQPRLMAEWRGALLAHRLEAAQILLARSDFDSRERYLNIRNCVDRLHAHGLVPIVNENDTVATEEISLGDNDVLAAKLAAALDADLLVILTTAEGVEDDAGAVVHEAAGVAALEPLIRDERSTRGRGGMRTKVEAARVAAAAAVPTVIGPGRPPDALARILAGEPVGTLIHPGATSPGARRKWIALSASPAGAIHVDQGAARALTDRGASLLAKGVTAVSGAFGPGDVVAVRNHAGVEIARGLTNLSSDELRLVKGRPSAELPAILGRRTHEEVIHRDHLVTT
jgi:glutamate 5-kinase